MQDLLYYLHCRIPTGEITSSLMACFYLYMYAIILVYVYTLVYLTPTLQCISHYYHNKICLLTMTALDESLDSPGKFN